MRQILTIFMFLALSVKMIACECPEYNLEKLDKVSYEWSDVILIGEIIKTGIDYKIMVIEDLKGKMNEKIIVGKTIGDTLEFDTCTFCPNRKGEYLLYLKKIVINGIVYYYSSECLGSRLLNLEYSPVSLDTKKSKEEIISETNNWINKLRKEK